MRKVSKSPSTTRSKSPRFSSQLWHWTLHWPENRLLGARASRHVDRILRHALVFRHELPIGFSFCGRYSLLTCSRSSRLHQERLFGSSFAPPWNLPSRWLTLERAMPDPKALRVNIKSAELRYWLLVRNERGPFAYGARRLDLTSRVAHHDFLVVARGQRGQGIAAQALANAVDLYRSVGIRHVHLVAGLTAGSSVWPKLGFRPTTADAWSGLCSVVLRNLSQLDPKVPAAFKSIHARSLVDAVHAVVASANPDGLFDLVDIDPGNAAANSLNPKLEYGIASELLRGGHWPGVLELDGEGGRRMEDYIREKVAAGRVDLPPAWFSI